MKLVVTGIKDGKITYLTGEETEISVPEIVNRISEIDNILSDKEASLKLMESVGIDYDEVLKSKAEEVEKIKASIDEEFKIFKSELLKKKEERETRLTEGIPDYESLEKEKAKLTALYNEAMSSIQTIDLNKVEESVVKEVSKPEAKTVIEKREPGYEVTPKKKKIIF